MNLKKLVVCVSLLVILTSLIPFCVSGQPELTPPRNLNAEGYDGYIDLDWRPPAVGSDRVDGYNIYRSLSSEQQEYYTSVDRYTQSYRDDEVVNGRTYHYWVTAIYDVTRETDFSNEASATPLGASVPTAPRDLYAYPGDSFVKLEWQRPESDGNSPIQNYIIYRGTSSDGLEERYTIGTVREYTDTDVTNGVTYYYGVVARNDVGDSEMSNIDSGEPTEGITTPEAPRNLKVLSGNSFVELYWDPPLDDGGSAIQNYRIERENGMRRFYNTGDDITFYQDETVTNGVTYVYRVSAVNVAGEGLKSSEVTARPTSLGIPISVGDLQAEAGTSSVTLTWSDIETELDIDYYNIYRGPNVNNLIYIADTDSTGYTDTDVEAGSTYYYIVRAVSNDEKLGLRSNDVSATIYESDLPADSDDETGSGMLMIIIAALLIILITVILLFVFLWKKKQKPERLVNKQPVPPPRSQNVPPQGSQEREGGMGPQEHEGW